MGRCALGKGVRADFETNADHATNAEASRDAYPGHRWNGKFGALVGELVKKSEINCKTTNTDNSCLIRDLLRVGDVPDVRTLN